MPQLLCKCGERFDLVTIPSPHGYHMISEQRADEIEPTTDAAHIAQVLFRGSFEAYRCPNCGRLAIFWEKRGNSPTFYLPEAGTSEVESGK